MEDHLQNGGGGSLNGIAKVCCRSRGIMDHGAAAGEEAGWSRRAAVRRPLLPLFAAVAFFGCADAPLFPEPDLHGTYSLVAVDDRPLPVLATDNEERAIEWVGGTLALHPDGSCLFGTRQRVTEKATGAITEPLGSNLTRCTYAVGEEFVSIVFSYLHEMTARRDTDGTLVTRSGAQSLLWRRE
jgi:hypothetical protein